MTKFTKKAVTLQEITPLCEKYGIDQILASIFVRRGITTGKDLLYFLEDDLRFQHEPFYFSSMEDAVERIISAKEEGEKVLVFGDSDVDGITSTAILYGYLKRIGMDVQWRLPLGDDPYGLSIQAVDDFAAQEGTLIITVDCGISNFDEIKHANDLGIDVIITDHHNPPEELPEAIVVVDPKTEDSNYPFQDISGAAVAYKLVNALRFAQTDFYNAEICILEINQNQEENNFSVDCIKIKNLACVKELHEKIIPGKTSIYDLKLPYFLQGQIIYSWDSQKTKDTLRQIFGSGIEFMLNDLCTEVSKVMPVLRFKTTEDLKAISKIGKYIEEENSIIRSLFNLYVSYCKKVIASQKPDQAEYERKDLQLVGLAALADIMPMKNENRIFVKNCISSIKKDGPRDGLKELFSLLKINSETINSTDLSWTIIPALNATGRLGQPDVALKLLLSQAPKEREMLAAQILDLNNQRKQIVQETAYLVHDKAAQSVEENQNKLCLVIDENIHSGLTGLFAARLMQDFGVPGIAVTFVDDICIGSMRSNRGFISTDFLDSFGDDFFINHGGHNYAAGFSFKKEKMEAFIKKVRLSVPLINLSEESEELFVDAEIPPSYFKPEVFSLIDTFEPYGNENSELVFLTKNTKITDAQIVGKKEPFHLKLTFDCGQIKIPGMFWSQADRLKQDIQINSNCDILYTMSHNYFNGMTTNQFILKDLETK